MKKLLICTQEMDTKSSTLGFFVRWVTKLAPFYEHITVICLYKGEFDLPANVTVLSLGKELNDSTKLPSRLQKILFRLRYTSRFYYYIASNVRNYQSVFIHMNDEYGILGGIFWKLAGKKIYHWRNHYAGNRFSNWIGSLCEHVFYTSRYSYTANKKIFPNGIQMPVGVDVESLATDETFAVPKNSLLFLARLDPSKKPELILEALAILRSKGIPFTMDFVGGTSKDKDLHYDDKIKDYCTKLGLNDVVTFVGAVPSTETYKYYLSHEIYINVARSGMLDKTIFKALAAGCIPITVSIDFNEMIEPVVNDKLKVTEDSAESLAERLMFTLALPPAEKKAMVTGMQHLVIKQHSLDTLIEKITKIV